MAPPLLPLLLLVDLLACSLSLSPSHAFHACFSICHSHVYASTSKDEQVLRTFFKQYGGSSWSRAAKENWLVAGQRISTWAGVTTDEGGKHVTALELRGRLPKLKGKPEKQQALVALLKRLRQLDLQAVKENYTALVNSGFAPKAIRNCGFGWP